MFKSILFYLFFLIITILMIFSLVSIARGSELFATKVEKDGDMYYVCNWSDTCVWMEKDDYKIWKKDLKDKYDGGERDYNDLKSIFEASNIMAPLAVESSANEVIDNALNDVLIQRLLEE